MLDELWSARAEGMKTHLDEQVKEALVIIGRGGRVGALDELAADGGRDRDVLADREAEDGIVGNRETVTVYRNRDERQQSA